MKFWHQNPVLKTILPVAFSPPVLNLSNVFRIPMMFIGPNAMPDTPQLGPSPIDTLKTMGRTRAFIITDEFSSRFSKKVGAFLETGDIKWDMWTGTQPEVPLDTVDICLEKVKAFEPDLIVALGGGSAIDMAKAVWIRYEREDIKDLRQVSPLTVLGLRKKALFAAVPTTSGTGSECTFGTVLYDVSNHQKFVILVQELVPDFAFLIPEFHATMPPKLTMGAGLDVLAHSMDAVTNPGCSDIPEALALKAIETTFEWLPRAYRDGKDMAARYKMMVAASMAGMVLNASICHFTHLLGHAFGAVAGQHHGFAVGFFIPYSLQWCAKATDQHTIICKHLGIVGDDPQELLDKLVDKVRGFLTSMDVPLALSDIISEKDFYDNLDEMALFGYEDVTNPLTPRPITIEECRKVFEYAYEGKDIDF